MAFPTPQNNGNGQHVDPGAPQTGAAQAAPQVAAPVNPQQPPPQPPVQAQPQPQQPQQQPALPPQQPAYPWQQPQQQPGPDWAQQQMAAQLQQAQQLVIQQQQQFERAMAEMQQRQQQLETAGLSDEERMAYELNVAQQQAAQYRQQAAQYQQQLADQQELARWQAYYVQQLGVPPQYLDTRSLTNMVHSANLFFMRMAQQQQQFAQQPQQFAPPQPQWPPQQFQPQGWQQRGPMPKAAQVQPPGVVGTAPGSPATGRRWIDIGPVEQERIMRQFESGKMNAQELMSYQFG